ncbi:hypothetical protein PFICI_11200 [Pestalotiopsis fici W106-1]|uniref:Rhodopsin domain-containing protein n=1 Tax=Pestalotiopsis fici (strain W106-1 / CGMCC3.15140) TaxID=1229662 RepID=W3WWS9_PESFW|nr:uncharacterized protein PFICI_11200 [Pestalotiopsis fici W106-1]ETS77326.1 hypothetical protein PFICI_11200 [Pestalotiopsis fici W106-1]
MSEAQTPFQVEGWVEWSLGVAIILLRLYARWKAVGFKGWKGDDYFSVLALILWTMDITVVTLVGKYETNIGVTTEMVEQMSPEEIHDRELGSKWLFTGWNTYVALIWTLKGCMLFFFNRITLGLSQQKFVKWTSVACVVTYLIMFVIIFTQCTPVSDNWRVAPIPGYNCSAKPANYISVAVLNVATDIVIVGIPIPLLFAVKLTVARKLAIGALLCSGVFVMIATLLRCVLSLQNVELINLCTIWAIRETFVAIIAVNAAPIKPLFSSAKWLKSTSKGGTDSHTPYNKRSNVYALSGKSKGSQLRNVLPFHNNPAGTQVLSSSEENIMRAAAGGGSSTTKSQISQTSTALDSVDRDNNDRNTQQINDGGIVVTTTYQVRDDGSNIEAHDGEGKW